jgi:hypothetical protein
MTTIKLLSDYRRAPPISAKEHVRFTPDHLKDRENPPVFLLKVPTVREKIAFESMMELEGLRYPQDAELFAAMRDAIKDQVVDHEHAGLIAIIEEAEEVTNGGEALSTELAEQLDQINRTLRPLYRPLGQLYSERRRYLGMVWLLRAQMFVMDVEGVDAPPLDRRSGYLSDESVEAIEARYGNGTITSLGQRTVMMMMPDETERKNSELLEPSPADQETSTAVPPRRMAARGKSSESDTKPILN